VIPIAAIDSPIYAGLLGLNARRGAARSPVERRRRFLIDRDSGRVTSERL